MQKNLDSVEKALRLKYYITHWKCKLIVRLRMDIEFFDRLNREKYDKNIKTKR